MLALVAGLGVGAWLSGTDHSAGVLAVARPIGEAWLDALTMTVVPLVTALLIGGVVDAGAYGGNAIARRAIAWFAGLLVLASLLGGLIALTVLDGWPLPPGAERLVDADAGDVELSGGNWLDGLIPTNVVQAAAEGAMVPLVLFALLFGFALTRLPSDVAAPVAGFFRGVAQAMLVIVGWVLWLAPIGVAALALGVGIRLGAGAFGVLLHYVLVVIVVCLAVTAVAQALAATLGRTGLARFVRASLPTQAIAMTTQSSLAALPAMMAAAARLGVTTASAGIILPLAVSVFRAASAAANVAVAVYLAHVHGVPVTAETLFVGSLVAAGVSIGAVGLPAQVSFFAVIAPVCIAMGVPIVLLPLLLAIETVPDIFRTLGNVTSDLAVARLAGERAQADPA